MTKAVTCLKTRLVNHYCYIHTTDFVLNQC